MDLANGKNLNFDLHFFDNGDFIHRKDETESKFLVQKKDNKIIRAWPLLSGLRFRFDGAKGVSAGLYTMTHDHDAVYDPYNQVGDSFKVGNKELFKRGGGAAQPLISKTKENTFKKHSRNKKKNPVYDKAFMLIGALIIILAIAIFITVVT